MMAERHRPTKGNAMPLDFRAGVGRSAGWNTSCSWRVIVSACSSGTPVGVGAQNGSIEATHVGMHKKDLISWDLNF